MRSPTSPAPPKPDTTPERPPSHAPPNWRRMVGSSIPDTITGVVGDHATFVSPTMAGAAAPWWGQSTHTLGFFVDEPHRIIPTLFVHRYLRRRHSRYRSRGAGVEVLTGVRSAAQTPETDRPPHSAEPRRARTQPPRASTGPTPTPYHIVRRLTIRPHSTRKSDMPHTIRRGISHLLSL